MDVEIMSQQVIYYSLLFVLLSVFIVRKFLFVLLLSIYCITISYMVWNHLKWLMRGNLGSLKRKRDQDPDCGTSTASSTIDVSPSLVAGILEHIMYSKMPTTIHFIQYIR